MTAVWLGSFLRAVLIGTVSAGFAYSLFLQINHLKGKVRFLFTILALLPLTLPPLLPAYAYSAFSFNFQTQPTLNEILYFLILISKTSPIGLILYLLISAPISKSASFCEQLLPQTVTSKLQRHSRVLCISSLLCLFAFHDYEIASLMRIKHWTVNLFNAHAGGLVMNLKSSFKMVLLPLLTSVTLIFSTVYLLKNCNGPRFIEGRKNKLSYFILCLSTILLLIYPLLTISSSLNGIKDALSGKWMLSETVNSLALTIVSTICCIIISFGVLQFKKQTTLFAIPGLLGALILGLVFISLFNLPVLSSIKQTIIPLCLAMIIYGLPFSILICLAIKKHIPEDNRPIDLLHSKNRTVLKWETIYLFATMASIPLFCFLWFDLTLSSMLAPASVTTLFPRLYNLMHYSENEKLSATISLITLVPFIIYLAVYGLIRLRVIIARRTSLK